MIVSINQLQPFMLPVVCLLLFRGLDLASSYRHDVLVLQIGREHLSFSQEALKSFQSCLCSSESCSVSLRYSMFQLKYLADKTSALTGLAPAQPPDSRTVFTCEWTRSHLLDFTPDSLDCRTVQGWERIQPGCDGRTKCEIGMLMPPSCPHPCVELMSAYFRSPLVKVLDKPNISRGDCRGSNPRFIVSTSKSTLIPGVNSTDLKTTTKTSDQDSVARDVTLLILGLITLVVLLVVTIFLVRRMKRFTVKSHSSHHALVEGTYCSGQVGLSTSGTTTTTMTSPLSVTLQSAVRYEGSIYEELDSIDALRHDNLYRPQQSSELPTCSSKHQESHVSVLLCKFGLNQSQVGCNIAKNQASYYHGVSQPLFDPSGSCSSVPRDTSQSTTSELIPSFTVTRDTPQNETACSDSSTSRGNNRSAANSVGTHLNCYLQLCHDDNSYSHPAEDNRSSTHTYETLKTRSAQVVKKPKVTFKSRDKNGQNDGYECVDY